MKSGQSSDQDVTKLSMDLLSKSLTLYANRNGLRQTLDCKPFIPCSLQKMAQHVVLETTMGAITVELYQNHAPKTCQNFSTLASRNYYNGTVFHRIIPDFMIQGGDPTGTGRGGSSIFGEKFEDEIKPDLKHTGAGILSMANSGPNTNGSQFFITLAPTPWLDGKHTIFGRVSSGMRVVQRMGLVQTGAEDRPVEEVKIVGARVMQGDEAD